MRSLSYLFRRRAQPVGVQYLGLIAKSIYYLGLFAIWRHPEDLIVILPLALPLLVLQCSTPVSGAVLKYYDST